MTGYDRDLLTAVLIEHCRTEMSGCTCGWNELGHSWVVHIADTYEARMRHAARKSTKLATVVVVDD